jgi:acetone carboxylase gamma subunit
MAYLCPDCGEIHRVEAPKAVQNDILDESPLSLMGIMKAATRFLYGTSKIISPNYWV